MPSKVYIKKVRKKPVDIKEEQTEQFKNAFILLHRKEQLFVDIKISPTISTKSNFNELISKDGRSLHTNRKFFHCDDDGSQSPVVKKAFGGLRAIILEAYRRFAIVVGLSTTDAIFDCGLLTTKPFCVQQVCYFLFYLCSLLYNSLYLFLS